METIASTCGGGEDGTKRDVFEGRGRIREQHTLLVGAGEHSVDGEIHTGTRNTIRRGATSP